MRFHPSAHLPANHPLLVGSTPRDPIGPAAATAFANPPPSMIQPAEMTAEQIKVEGRALLKRLDTDLPRLVELMEEVLERWHEFGASRDLACNEVFGCGREALRHRIQYWKGKCERAETSHLTDEEDKKNSLSKIAALPDPKEEEPEKPHVRSGDEILAELTAEQWEKEHYNVKPKPKAVQAPAEKQERVDRGNGKPKWAHPAWRELFDFIGKAINRNDAVNHLMNSPKDHDYIEGRLKEAFKRVEELHERAKHA